MEMEMIPNISRLNRDIEDSFEEQISEESILEVRNEIDVLEEEEAF